MRSAQLQVLLPANRVRRATLLDEGENIYCISRLIFSPADLAFGHSDSKPTVRRDTDDAARTPPSKTRRKHGQEQTGIVESVRRALVETRLRIDPRTVWQESEGRFPTCDPPRSGSGHTNAERFLPQLLRTINRPVWESDSQG